LAKSQQHANANNSRSRELLTYSINELKEADEVTREAVVVTKAENDLLTQTNKGTPMGEYFRRFWHPALLSEEVPAPDCPPVRVDLLGEKLLAFRNTEGKVGLISRYCRHRQAELFFGRNEENGIRCAYHGWKFDILGNCLEMTTEPPTRSKHDAGIAGYPCQEYAGIVWAYLGPKDLAVEFPVLEFNSLPQDQIYLRKSLLHCNYLQNIEGQFDSAHIGYLHSFLAKGGAAPAVGGVSIGKSEAAEAIRDALPVMEVRDTDYGFMLAAKRKLNNGKSYVRVTQWMLPVHTMIAALPGETLLWDAWVPADDEHTWVYRIEYNPWRPITQAEKYEYDNAGMLPMSVMNITGTYLPLRNRANDYLIDRNLQKHYSYSGIKGNNAQDAAMMENLGPTPIYDRTQEYLGHVDLGIVKARRRLLQEVRDFMDGKEPVPAFKGDLYNVRPIANFINEDDGPFYEQEEMKKYLFLS
jgi:phthalate 4,5-dioxygenase oxygenase subunit